MSPGGNRQEILDSSPGGVTHGQVQEGESHAQATREGRRMKWQPYPGYKPSGVGWIGEVPEDWGVFRLKNIARFGYGDSLAAGDRIPGDYDVYGSNGIVDQHERPNTKGPCLIIGRKGSFGKVAYSENPCFAIDTTYFIDSTLTRNDLRWLYYCLQWLRLDSFTKDSAVPGLSREDAYENFVPLCPIDNQRVIAVFLDRETGRIDTLMEKKQRQIELLQEKRAALISHAVTKGLEGLISAGNSQSRPDWQDVRIGRMIKLQRGFDITGANESDGHVPVISSGGLSGYSDKAMVKGPGVIVGRKGTLGTVNYIEEDFWPHDTTLWVKEFRGNFPRYVYYFLINMKLEKLDVGAANPTLNRNHVHPIKVRWPDKEAQETIAIFLDREISKIDVLIAKIQESIDRLKEYRAALISAAVTGKIDVCGEVRKAPAAFPRIVLAAEIVDRLHDDPNFGRVKFQKTLYLCEHHLGMDLEGNYWRQAAGPLDNRMLYSLENQMKRQKWFGTRRDGQKITYVPMEKAGGHRKYFDDCWADYREGLDSLLEVVRPLNTERAEIVATLFAAWNDLIIGGVPFNDEDILYEVKNNWHESKERFDEDRLRKALKWMRDKGLIPRGLGRATRT